MQLRLGGKLYDLEKVAKRISVWQYLELEEQAGVTVDNLQEGKDSTGKPLSSARAIAAYAFLIRRHNGDDVTFRQVAEELVPSDAILTDDGDGAAKAVPPKAPPASVRGAKKAAGRRA